MNQERVVYDGLNHIFPNTIANKRSYRDDKTKIGIAVVLIAVGCSITLKDKFNFLVSSTIYIYIFLVCIEISGRFCQLFEEYFHLESRYQGNALQLLRNVFSMNTKNSIAVPCSVFGLAFVLVTQGGPIQCIESFGISAWICSLAGILILTEIMKLEESPISIAKKIDELQGLDYGSGMAHSFFHGYLNLMLPDRGDERHGLREQMNNYESNNGVTFAMKKLFIFIPMSAYCPPNVNFNSNRIERGGNLEWRRIDRAGVQGRQYHLSVYKVTENALERPKYVCAEYATPLLTLHEVMYQNSPESIRYKRYQKEIVTNFYLTLHKLINSHRDCRDVCELIYYSDVDRNEQALGRDQLDVADFLIERCNQ